MASIKELLKSLLPQKMVREIQNRKQLDEWRRNGSSGPPPHIIKQKEIAAYQSRYNIHTLVETGTYLGDMVEAMKHRFKRIYSIELSTELFEMAKQRFLKDENITILQGDSGKVLPIILKQLNEPAIFWLDGHYSAGITAKGEKDCPIFEEIDAILIQPEAGHVILVDDARCFTGEGDYPTIDALTAYILSKSPGYKADVKYDMIRYTPKDSGTQ
jgi:hypothetical protein